MKQFAHLDSRGLPGMVDVSRKPPTTRRAEARCTIELPPATLAQLRLDGWRVGKGPVFDTAIIAATQAVKRTHELIPFCHPLPLESCVVSIDELSDSALAIGCVVVAHARTGVEMEALTGVTVAALTIYDMCKSMGHGMRIGDVRVVSKSGGTHDFAENVA